MDTPVYDLVRKYADKGFVRAHMPGHKGKNAYGGSDIPYKYDITEIKGADALYSAEGVIRESERNAASLFGTAETVYSAEGSSLCVKTMLASVCGDGRAFICARNVHRSVMDSCVLLGLEPLWMYPDYEKGSVVSGKITPEDVRENILRYAAKEPACVFITSPDYLGRTADINGISQVCHEYGIPLLVDNAHGAYLAFLDENIHPIKLGADMCCDSAHKTLPVLTGGAYIHTGKNMDISAAALKRNMALFGSTSPSWLILSDLDMCNRYLSENFRTELSEAAEQVRKLKERIGNVYDVLESEPLKLTVCALSCGMTGHDLADRLREQGVEPEYADNSHVVMMFSAQSSKEDMERTASAMESVRMTRIRIDMPEFGIFPLERAVLPREAFFSPKETVNTADSAGRISAETITVCPPCIPIISAGEIIDENTIKILKIYSIFKINVIK